MADQITKFARVIIPIPVDTPFSYSIPEDLADLIRPGVQVIVPVGERYLPGIVMDTETAPEKPDYEIKPIHDVVSVEPFIGEDLLKLLEWISDYYICHLGEACRLVNPALNLEKSGYELQRRAGEIPEDLPPRLREMLAQLPPGEWISLPQVETALAASNLLYRTHRLKKLGLIDTRYTPPRPRKIYKTVDLFALQPSEKWPLPAQQKYLAENARRYERARELIAYLQAQESGRAARPQLKEAGFPAELLKRLEAEGVLLRGETEVFREQGVHFYEESKALTLSEEQQEFIDRVTPCLSGGGQYKTFLLHGITGSGKTQVYIELIKTVLAQGRQAIVLIPEIVLTPQTMARFRNHFGEQAAVIHSRISGGEKLEILQKIREDKFSIVIGPRSAIFAPFKKLGIIIVDEEHEGSYKQNDAAPRYNARDVALYRAFLNRIPVVLGSATPSLESLYNARTGKYEYFHLSKRISARNLPRAQLLDFKEEWRRTGALQILSENLLL